MSVMGNKFMSFVRELRRRKTIRVSAAYIFVAWVLVEAASVVLPAFEAPRWILPTIIVALVVGLPIAIILSWIFDITPEGLVRTDDLDQEAGPDSHEAEAGDSVPGELKPSVAIPLGSAQRRQVSLLRCTFDLVEDGAAVSDPEAMLALIPALNRLIERVVERFAGYRLESSGSTFEILFGYPVAYENDALRAVAAGFALTVEAGNLAVSAAKDESRRVGLRIAVHSDLVVIEEAGDQSDAATVVGNTSMVAAWLQSLSAADDITISEETFELLRERIKCESLGEHSNVQTGATTTVFRAVELTSPDDVLEGYGGVTDDVYGRDSEVGLVLDRWGLAVDGEDQFVVLRGEPGIGKSALIREIVKQVRKTESSRVMPLYCSPFETSNAFHPIVEYLLGPGFRLGGVETDTQRADRVAKVLTDAGLDADRVAPLIGTLLKFGDAQRDPSDQAQSGEALRTEMLNCLLELFESAARRGNILVLFEDIHWADPSTLEFISMMVNGGSEAGALCLFTMRPTLNLEWESRSDVTVLDLQRLPRRVTENLVMNILGETRLPEEIVAKIVRETGGNPLYAEELTKAVAESVTDTAGKLTADLVLPGTLQQSLASRIDRLGSAKPLLQLCSLLGRRFDYELLKAASQTENEEALQQELRTIVNAEFLYQEGAVPDSTYRFKHILMQETAHNSLLKATRIELHAHVASILEEQFPEKSERQPELLAYHYGEGGQPDRAIKYWMVACSCSLETFAVREAIEQAENGLKELLGLPASTERDAGEIALRGMLGKGLLAVRGYADPQVEETFARALALSESVGNVPQLFQLVVGLWMYFFIGGIADHSLVLARRLVRIAESESSPAKSLQAYYCLAYSHYRLGKFEESRRVFERALDCEQDDVDFSSESASGDDTRIHVRCGLAHVYWHLGHVNRSLQLIESARELAEELDNPFGIVYASFMSTWLYMLRREPDQTAAFAEKTLEVAEKNSFRFWLPLGGFMRVWAKYDGGKSATSEDAVERIRNMETNLKLFVAAGATYGEITLALQVAEDLIDIGRVTEAEAWLAHVRTRIEVTSERYLEPELDRLAGLLSKARGDAERAFEFLSMAEKAARDAGSISLALRAATDLAAVHHEYGDSDLARELLASATSRMPEQEAVQLATKEI